MIHRWTIGRKINEINEPITLSCPRTIVEYHDYHPLIHNKITVNHKLVTMETCTRVTVLHVATEIGTVVTVSHVAMEIIPMVTTITSSHIYIIRLKLIHSTFIIFRSNILHLFFTMMTCLINFSDHISCKETKGTHVSRAVALTTGSLFRFNDIFQPFFSKRN